MLPQLYLIFNIGGDEPQPRLFLGEQIKWRPEKKRSSPEMEHFFPQIQAKTKKKVFTRNGTLFLSTDLRSDAY